MLKSTLTSLLAATVIGTTGTFAFAQQDPQLRVQQEGEDRAVITLQEGEDRLETMEDQQLSGTVVSLETYLREGASAARNEMASTAGSEKPMALLTDDGELYVILDKGDAQRQGRTAWGEADTDADSDTGVSAFADPNAEARIRDDKVAEQAEDRIKDASELNMATDSRTGGTDAHLGTSAERNARRDLDRAADADADMEVYGMAADAEKDKAHKDKAAHKKLKAGKQVTLTGDVYERDGIKGIAISQVQ